MQHFIRPNIFSFLLQSRPLAWFENDGFEEKLITHGEEEGSFY